MQRRQFIQSVLIVPVALSLLACSDKPTAHKLPKNTKVVALGDSLTFGYGAHKGRAYPDILAQKTGWQVVNMGVNGDTSQNVLDRVEAVIAKQPKLVLLGVGGNDILRKIHKDTTKNNIIQIISQLKNANIDVLLIAQPHLSASALFGKASDNPIYKQIAKEQDVPLLEKAWSKILSDNALKSDQIHANNAGYAKFADELYRFLGQLGYVS